MDVRRTFRDVACALAALALFASFAARADATVPSDLCTGDPCVVSGSHTVDPNSVLDFGAVALSFAGSALVQTQTATFKAASITLQPGAHVIDTACDTLVLQATAGDIALQAVTGSPSRIDGCDGVVNLQATGHAAIDGMMTNNSSVPYQSAGIIRVEAPLGVTMHGTLNANAVGISAGGQVELHADSGPIDVDGTIDVSNQASGGAITLQGTDVSVAGDMEIRGGTENGGSLSIFASGSVSQMAIVNGVGTLGNPHESCSGDASVAIQAGQNITLSGLMKLSGGGEYCFSGSVFLNAGGNITQLPSARIQANGTARADGGTVQIDAVGNVVLRDVDVSSTRFGGKVTVTSTGGAVQVLSLIKNRGPEGATDDTMITACDVYVAAKGAIDSRGPSNGMDLTASETMTIIGKLQAGDNGNVLHIREGAPVVAGTISPAASVLVEPGLPDCRPGPSCVAGGTCGDAVVNCGEECDDGVDNGTPSSSCDASCIEIPPALRIPGGGTKPFDCPYEWSMALDTVVVDPAGLPKTKQSCQDNDPSCDFEPAPGVCRFHVWSCLGGADARLACGATTVTGTTVTNPKATSTKPAEIAARQSIVAALAALGAPVGPGEECSPRYDIVLGVGQKTIPLKTKATFPTSKTDSDVLQFTCTP